MTYLEYGYEKHGATIMKRGILTTISAQWGCASLSDGHFLFIYGLEGALVYGLHPFLPCPAVYYAAPFHDNRRYRRLVVETVGLHYSVTL